VQALADGAGPDLVMMPRTGDFLSLVKSGYLADLSGYAAEYGWPARLLAPAMRLAAVRGELFGLPRSSETMLVNHYAGLGQVRLALRGEIAWTSQVFADAIELLIS
jgi:hypothetical protein